MPGGFYRVKVQAWRQGRYFQRFVNMFKLLDMRKITIIEADMFARESLERILAERQLDKYCAVSEIADVQEGICLWVGDVQDAVPSDLSIKESDQFKKPLRIGALLDRIYKHIAAEQSPDMAHILTIGGYELDRQNNFLTHIQTGEVIRLTDKETHILQYLHGHSGTFVERRALLDEVWGYADNVETHTLETHIYRLRQKIEKDPANPALLVTTEQGYSLNI